MNNDLISREALKKALEEDMKYGGVKTDEFDKGYDLGIKTAIEMLDNAPTEPNRFDEGYALGYKDGQNERPHGKWIPVSERLPEKSGRYFVTRGLNACGAMWNRTYIVNYSDLMGLKSEKIWWVGNVGKSDFERIDDVIAWQPLPEPYKKGANK